MSTPTSIALDNLFDVLARIHTSNNLLILEKELAGLVNHLTPFSRLKQQAHIDRIAWLHDAGEPALFDDVDSVIVLVSPTNAAKLEPVLQKKTTVVVPNLLKTFTYQVNEQVNGSLSFERVNALALRNGSLVRLSSQLRLVNWAVPALEVEDLVFSLGLALGGLQLYFSEPLEQVSKLADLVVETLGSRLDLDGNFIKFKNIYGKGDHAAVLINMLQHEKLPNFYNDALTPLEREFYLDKLSGNADLVVVERNLDYVPLLLSQLNYQGLIDDLFGIEDELNKHVHINGVEYKLDDELYANLKDLNFASIGSKLNKLAKLIQSQFQMKDSLSDLKEIRKLVANLGDLTTKQDLIKKHTNISEAVLDYIRANPSEKYNAYEFYLEFQNDLFDLDYKQQINYLVKMLDENLNVRMVLSLVLLISIVNNGIRDKDYDMVVAEVLQNHGVPTVLVLEKLRDWGLLVVTATNTDFLGALTGLSLGKSTPEPSPGPETLDNPKLGVTAAQNTYKSNYALIDKFWNLHPLDETEPAAEAQDVDLLAEYPHPSFTLTSNTVPLICRIVESLYFRDFLKYKPTNNPSRRPNWDGLGLDTMFRGRTIDINVCDTQTPAQQYVVVVLIGGITRSEITIFKYLQQKMDKRGLNKKLVVLTSGIVNGRKLTEVLAL